jgi:hypothetical protein
MKTLGILSILVLALACSKKGEEPAAKDDTAAAKPEAAKPKDAPEADKAPPPEPAKPETVSSEEVGFSIELPAGYKVKRSDDKQVVYEITMPDKWTPSITVRREKFEIKSEADVKQHAKDSRIGALDSLTKRDDGAFVAETAAKTVAGKERKGYRVYIGSLFADCSGNVDHMDTLTKICQSLEDTKAAK